MIILIFFGKKSQELSSQEELDLFLVIQKADNLDKVKNEVTCLYNSMSQGLYNQLYLTFKSNIPPRTKEDLEDSFHDGWYTFLSKRKNFITKTMS